MTNKRIIALVSFFILSTNADAFELRSIGLQYADLSRKIDVALSDANREFTEIDIDSKGYALELNHRLWTDTAGDSSTMMTIRVSREQQSEGTQFSVNDLAVDLRKVSLNKDDSFAELTGGIHFLEYDFERLTGNRVRVYGLYLGYAGIIPLTNSALLDFGYKGTFFAGKSDADGHVLGPQLDAFLSSDLGTNSKVRLRIGYRLRSYGFSESDEAIDLVDSSSGPYAMFSYRF